jgi:hypothetical protein
MSAKSHIYKVLFASQGKIYEIYAREVGHGSLFGFVEVEQLVFGERSAVVVDPSEERIKSEFAGVKRTKAEGGNVAQFPMPMFAPGGKEPGGDG